MEKIHAEERKSWEAERDRHKEKIAQAVCEAMQEQRKHNQVYCTFDWTCCVSISLSAGGDFLVTPVVLHCIELMAAVQSSCYFP